MFVKTFLVGLLLTLKAARSYINRNEDGIKAHMSDVDYMRVLNALDAITAVIDVLIGSPILAMGARVKRTDPTYQATLSNLRVVSADEYVRIPARVVRKSEAEKWL